MYHMSMEAIAELCLELRGHAGSWLVLPFCQKVNHLKDDERESHDWQAGGAGGCCIIVWTVGTLERSTDLTNVQQKQVVSGVHGPVEDACLDKGKKQLKK